MSLLAFNPLLSACGNSQAADTTPPSEEVLDEAVETENSESTAEPTSPFFETAKELSSDTLAQAYDLATMYLGYEHDGFGSGGAFTDAGTAQLTDTAYFCRDIQSTGDDRSDRLVIIYEVSGESAKGYEDDYGDHYTFYGYFSVEGIRQDRGLFDDVPESMPESFCSVVFEPRDDDGKQSGIRLTPNDSDKLATAIEETVNWEFYAGKSESKKYELEEVPASLIPQLPDSVTPNRGSLTDEEVDKAVAEAIAYELLPDVSIGMTEDEVLHSKWGEPEGKNITETKSGVSEQWVYPNNQYVYFEDGVVTGIQRSE